MPITKSAKRAFRKGQKNKAFNLSYKNKIKSVRKDIKKAMLSKDREGAKKLLSSFYKIVDKAAKKNIIRKNKAARLKSRTTLSINKIS